jgi:hypothetical protein
MDSRLVDQAIEAVILTNWRIHLIIPSILAPSETFSLKMTAFGPDDMPSNKLDRKIVIEENPFITGLPESVNFADTSDGHIIIEDLTAVKPGYFFITALPEHSPFPVNSNPSLISENPPFRLFWGDIHVHTTYSNCSPWACKDPEFVYAYARDASYLDFAAPADHLRGIASDEKRWPRLQKLSTEYNKPGKFVTFLAFESSHKSGFGGDNNAYFLNDNAQYFWQDREDMKGVNPEVSLKELWDFCESTGSPFMTIPHHTARAGKYRDFTDPVYDPSREPIFEIYSMWGSSETRYNRFPLYAGNSERPSYFQDALINGCRYGVMASSDDHTSMVGSQTRARNPFNVKRLSGYHHRGLTALRVPELTRNALWEALCSRNCYATTFSRTLLDVSINGVSMGQELSVSKNDTLHTKREIEVSVFSSDPRGMTASLIRNGEEIERTPLAPDQNKIVFTDNDDLNAIAVRDARFYPEPFTVYYIRIQNQFDQTQWSSPIWLDC